MKVYAHTYITMLFHSGIEFGNEIISPLWYISFFSIFPLAALALAGFLVTSFLITFLLVIFLLNKQTPQFSQGITACNYSNC